MRTAGLAIAFLVLTHVLGCAMSRHRAQLRDGLLTRGLHREAFLKEWGPPSRTFTLASKENVVRVNPFHASWGKPTYEVWEFPSRSTCLVFDGERLATWQTGKSDCADSRRTPTTPLCRR